MTCTIDANVVLYASDRSSPRHTSAVRLLERLADGPELVYLFRPAYRDTVDGQVVRGNSRDRFTHRGTDA